MEKIRILCYGDSNTWGFVSGTDHLRYGINERWTRVLAELLGSEYEVIEEGLNSRTLTSNDLRPGKVGKNGYDYLIPCLDTHDPIDLVVLMLGTNELRKGYHNTAAEIGEMLEEYFVKTILNRKSKCRDTYPKLLIIAPPPVNEDANYCREEHLYEGASKKSEELDTIYEEIADKYNCYFLSTRELDTGVDGVHITKESHKRLAEALKFKINKIYK